MTERDCVSLGLRLRRIAPIVTLVMVAIVFVCGFTGYWRYDFENSGSPPEVLSVLYCTAQLFIGQAERLPGAIPWELHVARIGGIIILFAGAVGAFFLLFRGHITLARLYLPWRKGHVVICGLGERGLRIALEGRRRGRFVVAIDRHADTPAVAQARSAGIVLLHGDATDERTLVRARLNRADSVIAACALDGTNVAIASRIGRLMEKTGTRTTPLLCRVMIRDPWMRDLFFCGDHFPRVNTQFRVNMSDLDHFGTAARQALHAHPLDFRPIHPKDPTVVHLVVIGFGPMGQALALHAAQVGHFANEVTQGIKPRMTIVDSPAGKGWKDFKAGFPQVDQVCEVRALLRNPPARDEIREFVSELNGLEPAATLATYAVCLEDDAANLQLGLSLAGELADRSAQVLVYQSTRSGYAALFEGEGPNCPMPANVHAFGMAEDILTWDALFHEGEDAVAKALHEDFRERHPGEAGQDWDRLSEGFKDSNRLAADHIPVKLRAIDCVDGPLQAGREPIEHFERHEVDLLAQMEHIRWCAERRTAGWQYGPVTDRARKISCCLVPWKDLPPKEQNKDPEQIRAILTALKKVRRGVYRVRAATEQNQGSGGS